MKTILLWFSTIFLCVTMASLLAVPIFAEIPRTIQYQGYLTDTSSQPIDTGAGTIEVQFSVYDSLTGGTPLWSAMQPLGVSAGLFNTVLGPFSDTIIFDHPYFLEVAIDENGNNIIDPTEGLVPRTSFTAVAYALNADRLDGKHADELVTRNDFEGVSERLCLIYALISYDFPDFCCDSIDVTGFNIQSQLNMSFANQLNSEIWESSTHTIEFGNVSDNAWEFLLKPGASGALRPAICQDSVQELEAGPKSCQQWAEWGGSSLGFVTVESMLGCGFCGIQDVAGFVTQSQLNASYSRRYGEQVWESSTHTIEFGNTSDDTWEFLLKPDESGALRPAICRDAVQNITTGPITCQEWAEWRGSSLGFVSIPVTIGCR